MRWSVLVKGATVGAGTVVVLGAWHARGMNHWFYATEGTLIAKDFPNSRLNHGHEIVLPLHGEVAIPDKSVLVTHLAQRFFSTFYSGFVIPLVEIRDFACVRLGLPAFGPMGVMRSGQFVACDSVQDRAAALKSLSYEKDEGIGPIIVRDRHKGSIMFGSSDQITEFRLELSASVTGEGDNKVRFVISVFI